jgi:predicted RNA-binding protein (virulence factor B family)
MIVNEEFQGMVFKNETFVDIEIGQQLPGYVRTIREDGLIDLSLNPIGRNKVEGHSLTIVNYLEKNRGFMKITDKTSPEIIKSELQMSKKSFKEAVGKLYKSRMISLDDNGVWLIQNE